MCGILALLSPDSARLARAESALALLRHRGPDDEGIWRRGNCVLGHTRLSILDLSPLGHQPMELADAGLMMVYNGEVYNHLEIRADLEAKGHTFRSTSDSETLLHAYAEWGEGMLPRLNGIFAFVIHDCKRGELFVARDQLGVKPLYYSLQNGGFVCASELKVISNLDLAGTSLDREALARYMYLLWCPGDKTPLRDVKKLLPGHYLRVRLDPITALPPRRYYTVPFGQVKGAPRPEQQWIDALDAQLTAAVERQMLSDVPVGFFLSGGLDSSLLVAIARKLRPNDPIRAFTMGEAHDSKEGFVDDLPYAQKVARLLKVDLEVVPANVEIVKDFDRMIWHLDEPQADAAPLNVLNICERARAAGCTVMIGGAGGDDLFSGYRRHQALRLEPFFRRAPRALLTLCARLAGLILPSSATARRAQKLLRDADKPAVDRMVGYFGWIEPAELTRLFSPEWQRALQGVDPAQYLKDRLADIPTEREVLNQMLYLELIGFLVDHNLNYTDKLGMAVGVEVRVPYLDLELVDFACGMPAALKMRGSTTKYLLRKVAERYLPHDVIYRPKAGFGAPVREWITGALHPLVCERLSRERLQRRGIFDPEAVWGLIERNRRGESDASYVIWSLLAIESWLEQFRDVPKVAA